MPDTPISPKGNILPWNSPGSEREKGVGMILSALMVEDTRSLHPHTPRIFFKKKSQRQHAPRGQGMSSQQNFGTTKSLGRKSILEYRGAHLGLGENAPRKSIFLAMALRNKSLQGVQTVSSGCGVISTILGGFLYTLSLLSPCRTPGALISLTSLGCISLPRLRATLARRWLWFCTLVMVLLRKELGAEAAGVRGVTYRSGLGEYILFQLSTMQFWTRHWDLR